MLPPSTIRRIEDLLAQRNVTYRQIADCVGVSHGTVYAVAAGRRGADDRIEEILMLYDPEDVDRCPECGALVEQPCRVCQLRGLLRHRQFKLPRARTPDDKPSFKPLGLNLKPEHQTGYEQVRRLRAEGRPLGSNCQPLPAAIGRAGSTGWAQSEIPRPVQPALHY